MKKVAFFVLFLILASTVSYAAKIEVEVPNKYLDELAVSMGYQSTVSTLNSQNAITKVPNPKTKSEFILDSLQNSIDVTIKNKLLNNKLIIAKDQVEAEYSAERNIQPAQPAQPINEI